MPSVVTPFSTAGLRLLIRADADSQIGVGHVMRCLALAQAWQQTGGEVTFLTHTLPQALHTRLTNEGCDVLRLEDDRPIVWRSTLRESSSEPTLLVLDGYTFDNEYQALLHDNSDVLMVIDDYGHSPIYQCDLILNQNLNADPGWYKHRPSNCRLLLGPEFALLRSEFIRGNPANDATMPVLPSTAQPPHVSNSKHNRPQHILVTMGGADPVNATETVVNALVSLPHSSLPHSSLPAWQARIVVGAAYRHLSQLEAAIIDDTRFEIILQANDMSMHYRWADIAVAAGGASNWEMSHLGVPRLVLEIAANQAGNLPHMVAAGLCITAELEVDSIAKGIERLLGDVAMAKVMRENGPKLIDGLGARRVAEAIHNRLETKSAASPTSKLGD